jgi:hypothetical protein
MSGDKFTDSFGWMDATAQAELVAKGEATPLELVEAAIARIERLNPRINCVVYPRYEKARAEARASHAGRGGIFRGVPFLLKDLSEMVAGEPTSWGWKALKDAHFVARSTSHIAGKFRDAGLITLGHTTVPEWGPFDRDRNRRMGRDPQSMEPRARCRWIERRRGCGGRVRNGCDRAWQRCGRVDSHPGIILRSRGPQAFAWAHLDRTCAC